MRNVGQSRRTLLIIDDDAAVVDYLTETLVGEGYLCSGTTSPLEGLEQLKKRSFDMVISDVEMPQMRGLDLVEAIHEIVPQQLVLLITAFGDVEMAVRAVQRGACDFLTKPFRIEALLHAIERAFSERQLVREVIRLRDVVGAQESTEPIVASSEEMKRVLAIIHRAAESDAPVLITGETGTGKSLLARLVHEKSSRRTNPFVSLNCAALPTALAESELFGARRGAYTDAKEDREGLFAAAGSGTLFLDEVSELALEVQAKLLHAIETGLVRPLGSRTEVAVAARMISATNRLPEDLIREGSFRADLYYRINVVRVEIPPLRERKDDILPLAERFLDAACRRYDRKILGMSASVSRALVRYPWPGNVRELSNVMERAVAMSEHDAVLSEDLLFEDNNNIASFIDDAVLSGGSLEAVEQQYVHRVLRAHGGNKAAAAKALGITRKTLYRKLGD